jgi:hypothetical protein
LGGDDDEPWLEWSFSGLHCSLQTARPAGLSLQKHWDSVLTVDPHGSAQQVGHAHSQPAHESFQEWQQGCCERDEKAGLPRRVAREGENGEGVLDGLESENSDDAGERGGGEAVADDGGVVDEPRGRAQNEREDDDLRPIVEAAHGGDAQRHSLMEKALVGPLLLQPRESCDTFEASQGGMRKRLL